LRSTPSHAAECGSGSTGRAPTPTSRSTIAPVSRAAGAARRSRRFASPTAARSPARGASAGCRGVC